MSIFCLANLCSRKWLSFILYFIQALFNRLLNVIVKDFAQPKSIKNKTLDFGNDNLVPNTVKTGVVEVHYLSIQGGNREKDFRNDFRQPDACSLDWV